MMTNKEFFIETAKSEIPVFERVLDAMKNIPEDKLSYKPDPKSRTGFELASQTLGAESGMFEIFLKTGKIDFMKVEMPKFKTVEDIKNAFSKNMKAMIEQVEDMNDEEWEDKASMYMGGKSEPEWDSTKGKMAWGFIFDLVHHRGQLATYLRPMGGKVPSIYGPSADMN